MVRIAIRTLAGMAMIGLAIPGSAKVVQASNEGFVLSHKAEVQASPDLVWAALVHPERWWNKEHSWSGDAANFSITLVPGGCFCERLANSGFVEHAHIINNEPSKLLRLSGALGPLQGEAVVGTLTFTITPGQDGASIISLEYVVGGYSRLSLLKIAPLVDSVIGEQHGRLLKFIASGKPD
jgi:uncharacterized protein YndB with AHSA1/START domain